MPQSDSLKDALPPQGLFIGSAQNFFSQPTRDQFRFGPESQLINPFGTPHGRFSPWGMGYDFFTFVGVNPAAAFVEITYDFKYWINPAVVDHVDYINYDPSDPTKKQYFLGPGNWDMPDPSWLNNAWEQTVDVEVQSVSTMLSVKDVRQDVTEPEDGLPAIFVSKQIDEDTLKQFFVPVVNLPPTSTLGFMFSTTSNPLTEDPDRLHPYLPFIPVCGFWRNYFGMDVDVGQLTIFDSVGTATMVTVTFVVMGLVMNLGLDNYFGGGGDYTSSVSALYFHLTVMV